MSIFGRRTGGGSGSASSAIGLTLEVINPDDETTPWFLADQPTNTWICRFPDAYFTGNVHISGTVVYTGQIRGEITEYKAAPISGALSDTDQIVVLTNGTGVDWYINLPLASLSKGREIIVSMSLGSSSADVYLRPTNAAEKLNDQTVDGIKFDHLNAGNRIILICVSATNWIYWNI